MKVWRDLELGEEKKVGDRFVNSNHEWEILCNETYLGFEVCVTECTRIMQREVIQEQEGDFIKKHTDKSWAEDL